MAMSQQQEEFVYLDCSKIHESYHYFSVKVEKSVISDYLSAMQDLSRDYVTKILRISHGEATKYPHEVLDQMFKQIDHEKIKKWTDSVVYYFCAVQFLSGQPIPIIARE